MSSTGVTRRELTSAAAGAGLGYAVATPVLDALAARPGPECVPGKPGSPSGAIALGPGGRTAWTTDFRGTTITARPGPGRRRGRSIDVGGAPVDLALAPGGRLALVTTAFYDRPALAIVELRSGRTRRVAVGDEPGAVAFAPRGQAAYVICGGAEGTLSRVRPGSGAVERTVPVGAYPRGLAITADGEQALVALNGEAALAVVELRGMRVSRIETPAYPGDVAVVDRGRRAVVTHDGLRARTVSVVDLRERAVERSTRVGSDPAAIAASAAGAVVATRSGRAVVLDDGGRRRRAVALGGRLEAVAVWRAAAWLVDGRTGHLHRVRLGGAR